MEVCACGSGGQMKGAIPTQMDEEGVQSPSADADSSRSGHWLPIYPTSLEEGAGIHSKTF
eukprot:10251770-Ditylum_brightwellii.AAC.1